MPDPAWLILLAAIGAGASVALVFLLRQSHLTAQAARLEAALAASRRAADDERARAAETDRHLRDAFAALSRDALRDNRQEFAERADQVLRPVRETLDKVHAQLAEVDKAREGSFRAVASQLQALALTQDQLRSTTEGLSQALRSPNVRGRWGEVQLRRIVELAGMLEQCDFLEKPASQSAAGTRQTPDLVVRLPGDSNIVVDAKVPIDAYLSATNARGDAERQALLVGHARQVREHIRTLGGKEYWRQFEPAPEFGVMFLPLEPLLAVAFEQDGTLLEQAAALRVIPATPMTLLALLKAVAYGWQQQAIARNAEEIQILGRDLYDRLATLVDHLESVGRNIKLAADSYDRFVGSLEQKVLPGARRFKELGVSTSKDLETPEPINLNPRRVTKDELTRLSDTRGSMDVRGA
jgi:DNA recombination protein RmuC